MTDNLKSRMPVWFIGHGSPMNAIEDNSFTRALRKLGENLINRPVAILVISAHWLTKKTCVSTNEFPSIIYDFYGFPDELYRVKYPATGTPVVAEKALSLIRDAEPDNRQGLDHGTWSILLHLFPAADIPVFQLSIDLHQPPVYFIELGNKLKTLREVGVLVIGSGNIVHNLRYVYSGNNNEPFPWTIEFDQWVWENVRKKDIDSLAGYSGMGRTARLAVPTPDHYIPMLCCAGFIEENSRITNVYEEVFTSISMRCFSID